MTDHYTCLCLGLCVNLYTYFSQRRSLPLSQRFFRKRPPRYQPLFHHQRTLRKRGRRRRTNLTLKILSQMLPNLWNRSINIKKVSNIKSFSYRKNWAFNMHKVSFLCVFIALKAWKQDLLYKFHLQKMNVLSILEHQCVTHTQDFDNCPLANQYPKWAFVKRDFCWVSCMKRSLIMWFILTEQWKPINPEEKKRYDREFLLGFQFISASMSKPEGLPHISDVVLEKVMLPSESARQV